MVGIRYDLQRTMYYVHRLVLDAFVGPCPEGMEARHLNGNSMDNRLENLAWSTHAVNMADKFRHGTVARGSKSAPKNPARGQGHGRAKLSESDVMRVLELISSGHRDVEIAAWFSISRHAIRLIRIGHNWAHLPRAA
jgi:hypothetical protein